MIFRVRISRLISEDAKTFKIVRMRQIADIDRLLKEYGLYLRMEKVFPTIRGKLTFQMLAACSAIFRIQVARCVK